jgi:hypothetical protein
VGGPPVDAWRVHDTGLVAVPSRYRRLGGLVRHLQGHGAPWPDVVRLEVADGELLVAGPDGAAIGRWPVGEVTTSLVTAGPPVSFVLELPDASHLLAAAASDPTWELLATLS